MYSVDYEVVAKLELLIYIYSIYIKGTTTFMYCLYTIAFLADKPCWGTTVGLKNIGGIIQECLATMDVVLLIVFLPLFDVVNIFFPFFPLSSHSFMLSSSSFQSIVLEFVVLNSARTISHYIFYICEVTLNHHTVIRTIWRTSVMPSHSAFVQP